MFLQEVLAMEILSEILRVVTSKADIKKIFPELTSSRKEDNMTALFVKNLLEGSIDSDKTAAHLLYGGDRQDPRYRTLKSRVYDRLLHAVLLLQVRQPEHSLYLSSYYKCSRNLIAAQTLMRFASRRAGTYIAERSLSIAERFQFTDVQLALNILLRSSAGVSRRRHDFYRYHNEVNRLMATYQAELESDFLLDQAIIESMLTSRKIEELQELLKTSSETISGFVKEYGTNSLRLNSFRIRVMYAETMEDHQQSVAVSEEALNYLNNHAEFAQPARLGEFALNKINSCICLRRFDEALTIADLSVEAFTEGGNNWYMSLDSSFVAAIKAGAYERAEEFYTLATRHRRFHLQSEVQRERWITYGAYLHLAQGFGLCRLSTARSSPFRLGTYMNSVTEFTKDKRFANSLVLTAQLGFLTQLGDYEAVERRIEYLRTYAARYLRERRFDRTRLFIRVLTQFPRFSFDPKTIRRDAADLIQELKNTGTEPMPGDVNELIPYELFIESMLTTVDLQNALA
jgi:hypothetical protein